MNNLILDHKKHKYYINNKELISVSEILNNYFGNSYNKVPKEILEKAKIRGNVIHKILELYFKNINNININKKLKELINKKNFSNIIKNYCNTAINSISSFILGFKKEQEIKNLIIEKSFNYKWIAGTPDLILNDIIIDYKTYKIMTKELRLKAELQLTAYYWLLINNGIKISNLAYIYWIKEDIVEIIKVEITKAKLHEWEMAIALFKEEKNPGE